MKRPEFLAVSPRPSSVLQVCCSECVVVSVLQYTQSFAVNVLQSVAVSVLQ